MSQERRAISPETQLASFLARYTPEIAARADAILQRMRTRLPHALELVYDNYNALAVGFGPTERASDAIFSIAVYPRWVSLFFLQAKRLEDTDRVLQGRGTVVKHVRLDDESALDSAPVRKLMERALETAIVPLAPSVSHRVIIKSVSAKQRPRRPKGLV